MSGPVPARPASLAALRAFTAEGRKEGSAPGPASGIPVDSPPLDPLQRIARRRREPPRPGEHCEMCGEPLAGGHGHVADLEGHRLLCACRGCYLLFTGEGAGGRRYRAVPTGSRRLPALAMSASQWDRLQIPVDLAFFFRQTGVDHVVACYPGPGGSTESTLDLSAWSDIEEGNPALSGVAVDVEAVLIRRHGDGFECFITPIDACYELVGLVRRHWTGFAGGAEVWARIGDCFERLRARSADVAAG